MELAESCLNFDLDERHQEQIIAKKSPLGDLGAGARNKEIGGLDSTMTRYYRTSQIIYHCLNFDILDKGIAG